ncbi:MAG TPA: hypothetical protein VNT55_12770 [Baekduia sp.]|nr:hypothetical protein [Baekduia sp.]
MTSNLMLAKAYIVLAALGPSSAPVVHGHPAHAGRSPQPPRHVARAAPLALTPASARLRAEREDGQVALSAVGT